jgi:arylsulfatase A-like enzyme
MKSEKYNFGMLNLLVSSILLWLSLTTPIIAQEHDARAKPNIVLIMADDLGYGDLGCYGQQKILTPNIDQLASQGMRFTQAYAGSSVCAPSRCSLLTGFHNGHNRVRDNIPHGIFLQPDDFTVAELLKQKGYTTGGIGKYSLGNPGSWGVAIYQGFDYYYGHLNQDQAHFYYPDYLWENDQVDLLSGNRGGKRGEYTHDLFTEKALSFIQSNSQKPFFLYLPYTIPHFSDYEKDTPDVFAVPSDEPYTDKQWPQVARNYAAMITRMDGDVGRIMSLIKELGIEENTLVIFTSDNGPWQGVPTPIEFFDSNGPLRGGKREMYEGGVRVPFIAKWKNTIPASSTSDHIITFWDLLPTVADMIGYPSPLETDGLSFLPVMLGNPGEALQHRYLYWDYGHIRDEFMQGVRYGKYKGIALHNGTHIEFELYDLEVDPGEENNIAEDNPGLVQKMKTIMTEAYQFDANYPRRVAFE